MSVPKFSTACRERRHSADGTSRTLRVLFTTVTDLFYCYVISQKMRAATGNFGYPGTTIGWRSRRVSRYLNLLSGHACLNTYIVLRGWGEG